MWGEVDKTKREEAKKRDDSETELAFVRNDKGKKDLSRKRKQK